MKHPEEFSDEAVLRRSQKATHELAVAARSAKVKRELDNAAMNKKERRPLKEFTDFRTELSEHVGIPAHSLPPNILILRRKTIRQFPNNVMVALYFNDKLGQYFSIPYGGVTADETVITPVALKEESQTEELIETVLHQVGDEVRYRLGADGHLRVGKVKQVMPEHLVVNRDSFHYKVPKDSVVHNSRTGYTREELNEDAISHLQKVKAFQTDKPLYHKDGSQTKVDPTTANALLTVHHALHPDNQKKMADAMEHSKAKFHKMLDFAWKSVK